MACPAGEGRHATDYHLPATLPDLKGHDMAHPKNLADVLPAHVAQRLRRLAARRAG